MSLKNVIKKEILDDGKRVRLTFDAHDGERTYEYKGIAAHHIIKRGGDPQDYVSGKLVGHKKK